MSKITIDREVLELALEALNEHEGNYKLGKDGVNRVNKAIATLRAALKTTSEAASAVAQPQQKQYTYASTQATRCAVCGEHKHTPLRIDAMGGYVCLTCIDQKLGSLLGEFGYPSTQQEPVARVSSESFTGQPVTVSDIITCSLPVGSPLYTSPPSRKPLTDEEILSLWSPESLRPVLGKNKVLEFARAIEAAHGIK